MQIIHIVDPTTMEIVANITKDQSGAPLTNTGSVGNPENTSRTWNGAVLVEVLQVEVLAAHVIIVMAASELTESQY